jgi:type VI secretion system protein ImpM
MVFGFYGKLPARGDFVRVGLPRDFVEPWDAWLQSVMTGSQSLLGEAWLPAFLEAPVWRFSLPAGMCGSAAVLGLMLPSVDKAGRYFPLTFAALRSGAIAIEDETWLDQCEAAGLAALEQDSTPQEISAMLGTPNLSVRIEAARDAVWWREGEASARMTLRCMPDAAAYAAMLTAATSGDASGVVGEGRREATS